MLEGRRCIQCFSIVVLLYALASTYFIIQHDTGDKNLMNGKGLTCEKAIDVLNQLQISLSTCMAVGEVGLKATMIDRCNLKFSYRTHGFKNISHFSQQDYEFDICETILLWEQFRNVTTVLTREYLDARTNGWKRVAASRISELGYTKCYRVAHCEEYLDMLLPSGPPFYPRQYRTCAVVGNSAELLESDFGEEIDQHDAVIRINEAPVNETYTSFIGSKRDFRMVDRRAARKMISILNGSDDEILIMHSATHKELNPMIKAIRNPVFLLLGVVPGSNGKGTMLKAIEFATSVCDIIDVYGYSFDPTSKGFAYFPSPTRLRTRPKEQAYYQLLDCLGVIRIHTPIMVKPNRWGFPTRNLVRRVYVEILQLRQPWKGAFSNCKEWSVGSPMNESMYSHILSMRKNINLSKVEVNIRKEARDHFLQMERVRLYRNESNHLKKLLCLRHPN